MLLGVGFSIMLSAHEIVINKIFITIMDKIYMDKIVIHKSLPIVLLAAC